ncbi:hypothetical protein S245_056266, partial [Arachis hypogaea]
SERLAMSAKEVATNSGQMAADPQIQGLRRSVRKRSNSRLLRDFKHEAYCGYGFSLLLQSDSANSDFSISFNFDIVTVTLKNSIFFCS